MANTKIVLVTSVYDASPRILTQALFMNASIMVNTNIIGGFKYANPMTGQLFLNEEDVVDKVKEQLERYERGDMNPFLLAGHFSISALIILSKS